MAEAVFRNLVQQKNLTQNFTIDSCGTGGWHIGKPPHHGTRTILEVNNISYQGIVARKLSKEDFKTFNYIIPMDKENEEEIRNFAARENISLPTTKLLLSYGKNLSYKEVPDPYYTGQFDLVFQLISEGCNGLLDSILTPSPT